MPTPSQIQAQSSFSQCSFNLVSLCNPEKIIFGGDAGLFGAARLALDAIDQNCRVDERRIAGV
jgi:hypothetical protein